MPHLFVTVAPKYTFENLERALAHRKGLNSMIEVVIESSCSAQLLQGAWSVLQQRIFSQIRHAQQL